MMLWLWFGFPFSCLSVCVFAQPCGCDDMILCCPLTYLNGSTACMISLSLSSGCDLCKAYPSKVEQEEGLNKRNLESEH